MVDVAISVGFAISLAVFLGWCLWRVCKPEFYLRTRTVPSNHITAPLSPTGSIVTKEEVKGEEPAEAA